MFSLKRREWMSRGNCRGLDPSIFISERGVDSTSAKKVCVGCPVTDECLEYALEENEDGVWGATSERDRRKIRRERAQQRRIAS